MPEVRNTSKGDLTLVPGGRVPAGGSLFIPDDVLARGMQNDVIRAWFDEGRLVTDDYAAFDAQFEADSMEALKDRARALGVKFGQRISYEKLAERVAEAEANGG